jgi:hypothetical protein
MQRRKFLKLQLITVWCTVFTCGTSSRGICKRVPVVCVAFVCFLAEAGESSKVLTSSKDSRTHRQSKGPVGFVFLGRQNLVAVGSKRNKFGGAVAKWKGKGLQSLQRRFDSASPPKF